jgi:hypothetical protein
MPSARLLPGRAASEGSRAASEGRAVAGSERDSLAAPSRPLRSVVLPATVGAVLGLLLSTAGFIGVAFGNGTMCTTYYETGHHCDALNRWLEAGLIGQGLILAASVAVLFTAPVLASKRKAMAITAWCLVALAIAWYVAYATGAHLSYEPG